MYVYIYKYNNVPTLVSRLSHLLTAVPTENMNIWSWPASELQGAWRKTS